MFKIPILDIVRVDENRAFTVKRKSQNLVDVVTGSASVSVVRTPPSDFQLRLVIAGYSSFGDVVVTGTIDTVAGPAAASETFTFTENTFLFGFVRFTAITSIDMSSFSVPTEGTIEVFTIGAMNEAVFFEDTIGTIRPSFQPTSSLVDKLRYPESGPEEEAFSYAYQQTDDPIILLVKDVIEEPTYGRFEVIHIAKWFENHNRVRLKKL